MSAIDRLNLSLFVITLNLCLFCLNSPLLLALFHLFDIAIGLGQLEICELFREVVRISIDALFSYITLRLRKTNH